MAAKSGEGVNLCFQKIAAELLGIRYKINNYSVNYKPTIFFLIVTWRYILLKTTLFIFRLTKAEQEHHQKVVKAEIVTYPQNRILSNPQSVVKTAVCCLQ